MHSKLFIASLAAVAHQAQAVNTQAAQATAQAVSTPAEQLIGIYENCQVMIDNLIGSHATMGSQLQLTPSFTFSGIDENCPAMSATVWMEPPPNCSSQPNCPQDGLTVTIDTPVNGEWSHEFLTTAITGEWFAHVTITPTGFDCAMSITEECTAVDVSIPCTAAISGLTASNSVNTAMGPADTYYGPDGINHQMNWSVSDLWNCQTCATYSTKNLDGSVAVSNEMTQQQVIDFSSTAENSKSFTSASTYMPFTYEVEIYDCTTQVVRQTVSHTVNNPHPPCTVTGTNTINAVTPVGTSTVIIEQAITSDALYSCAETEFYSVLTNNDWYSSNITLAATSDHSSAPTEYTPLVWANMPIAVNSTVSVSGRWASMPDSDYEHMNSFTAEQPYQPGCVYSVDTPIFAATIVEGTDWASHQTSFNVKMAGVFANYCPGFNAEYTLYRNGAKQSSMSLNNNQIETFYSQSPDYTGKRIHKTFVQDFEDGTFCVEFSMTPIAAEQGETPVTLTSSQVCQDVVAPACSIEPFVSFNGVLNTNNYIMAFTNLASYTANLWCQPGATTFSWMEQYMNQPWGEVSVPDINYEEALIANATVSDSFNEQESDYQQKTSLDVVYTPTTFSTQAAATWSANATYSHELTCRPTFAFEPEIAEVVTVGDVTFTFQINFETLTTGYANCGEMTATMNIYNTATTPETLVKTVTLDDATLALYQNQTSAPYEIPGVAQVSGCYIVQIQYGRVGHTSSTIQASTDTTCVYTTCILSDPTITLNSQSVDNSGDNILWSFDTSVTGNRWCDYYNTQVCVKDMESNAEFCKDGDQASENSPSATVAVKQTGDFAQKQFSAIVSITSNNATHVSNSLPVTVELESPDCKFNYQSKMSFVSDTLKKVTVLQTTEGTSGAVCGAASIQFEDQLNDKYSPISTAKSYTWNSASDTGMYSYRTTYSFANFDQVFEDNVVTGMWTQGCSVKIDNADITSFIRADNATDTSASAVMFVNGSSSGDCGDAYTITATLADTVGNSYNLDVNTVQFLSTTGQTISQNIVRSAQSYTLSLTITATAAQSIAQHQAMTSDTGYTNQLTDSSSVVAISDAPLCAITVVSFKFVDYAEVTNWSGPVLASYTGSINVEKSCGPISVQVRTKVYGDSTYINATFVDALTSEGGYTYGFAATAVTIPNEYGDYQGRIVAQDTTNSANKVTGQTDNYLWDPPCYLDIVNFEKMSQRTTVNDLKTAITYNVHVQEHGDDACRSQSLITTMTDASGTSLQKTFDSADVQSALSTDGFNYTIAIDTGNAQNAVIDWTDGRAVANATSQVDGWTASAAPDCAVNILNFCLDSATDVGNGRSAFTFTLQVEANVNCGALTGSLNIVKDGAFGPQVALPSAALSDSADCHCDQSFTVEADVAFSPGEVMGQVELRNSAQQIVLISDSCTLEI